MIKYLIEKEIKQFFRHPFMPKAALVIPVIVILVLPLVVTMDVKNVKVCVQDNDNSTASVRLLTVVEASRFFKLTDKVFDFDRALSRISYGTADLILRIPPGFEEDLLSGNGARVAISANATDAMKASLGTSYLTSIVNDFSASYVEETTGMAPQEPPVAQLNRFNPRMDYRTFVLPGLLGMIVIIISCVFPALAIVSEKENGTMEQINVTPVKRWQFILAKLIPYWILGVLVLSVSFFLAWVVYGFKPEGSLLTIYAASVLMTAAMSGQGLLISNVSNTYQQAIFLFFFVMIVSILMSGLYTSTASMPAWAQWFARLMPPKYFMEIMRGVYLKGSTFVHLWTQFLFLFLFAAGFGAAAVVTYRKRS